MVEANRLVRDWLAALLDVEPDFKVVAVAEGTDVGLLQVQQTEPHVVLVNAALGNHSSHRLVESVRKTAPKTRVIVMDLLPAQQDVIEFIKAGASGFIMKDATVDDFFKTIRSVAEGANVFPPALTKPLFSHIAEQAVIRSVPVIRTGRRATDNFAVVTAPVPPGVTEAVRMTKREREITDLIAEGLSNKEIAQRLNLATYTIKSHVHNILEKLALRSRLQIAAHAHKAGAPPTDPPTPAP